MTDNWQEWNKLEESKQVDELIESSRQRPQLIFKYSPRCSISVMVEERMHELNESFKSEAREVDLHRVDVVNTKEISNYITQRAEVRHESPQVLLWRNGNVQWHASHLSIENGKILQALEE